MLKHLPDKETIRVEDFYKYIPSTVPPLIILVELEPPGLTRPMNTHEHYHLSRVINGLVSEVSRPATLIHTSGISPDILGVDHPIHGEGGLITECSVQ